MTAQTYWVVFEQIAVTAVQDFFEITAPADSAVELHEVKLSQTTDVGDSAEEMLSTVIQTGATTSGSGGAAATPSTNLGGAAAGTAAEVNNTTEASAGTILNRYRDSWNIRAGWHYLPLPEDRIILSPSARLTVTLITTPGDSLTMDGTLVFSEIGG